ncbi:MAG: hypothetical protein KAR20_29165, partial [Candidatus Heimdallarchaeota archaeon]|nr:hypothetical protein [Candidatus Heimdallarchaeota archaeon]
MHKSIIYFFIVLGFLVSSSCVSSTSKPKLEIESTSVSPSAISTNVTVDIKFVVKIPDSIKLARIREVIVDLSNLGGIADQKLFDDGTNGDALTDDMEFTYILVGYTSPGTKQILSVDVFVHDFGNDEATDTIEIQVVAHPKILTFTVSKNPATLGDTITFTATVDKGEYPLSDVVLDLSNIGGNAASLMNNIGGTWTLDFIVPDSGTPPLPSGDYEVTLIASDDQIPPYQSTKILDLTLIGLNPSVVSSSPEQTVAAGDPLFEIEIKAPSGLSEITKVTGDFTAIGGSSAQQLFDDGTNGDKTADDGIFSFTFNGAGWDPAIVAKDTAYVEFEIDIERTSGITVYSWAPLFVYSGVIVHVDGTYGNDTTGAGTDVNPYKTIQKGIDSASSGDLVLVHIGTYTGAGNYDLYYNS